MYAVGDIHGCLEELKELLELIERDCREFTGGKALIFVGDYVDRGPESAGVLQFLTTRHLLGVKPVFLRGNHDAVMLECYESGAPLEWWLANGGTETLASYGLMSNGRSSRSMLERMREVMPERDVDFLRSLRPYFKLGDYAFVHAGIRPGVPLDKQVPEDLLWIREGFLDSCVAHEAYVVHGHSISFIPDVRINRMGIDTGCFRTGRLTAVVLEGAERRFLHTPFRSRRLEAAVSSIAT